MDIVDQIIFWTEISKEHPIVVNRFAQLSNIDLPRSIVAENMRFSQRFEDIQNQAKSLKNMFDGQDDDNWNGHSQRGMNQELSRLVRRFLMTDRQWIGLLNENKRYGRNDTIFVTLMEHMIDEQTYAYNVIATGAY